MRHATPPPVRLRDVFDVEAYVREAIAQAAPAGAERETLLSHGVQAVLRLERALPPGVPLTPLLDELLPVRIAALAGRGDRALSAAA